MTARFALHSAWVRSQNDGDRHFIDAPTLARLYGLRPGEWIGWNDEDAARRFGMDDRAGRTQGLLGHEMIHLYPRYDGAYRRPE